MDRSPFISAAGIGVLMAVAWLCSSNRRRVNWRVVAWGGALQLLFAAFVFRVPAGRTALEAVNRLWVKVLELAAWGPEFVFGSLATGRHALGFILAFQGLPLIVFFSALMALLYFYGILPLVVRGFAWIFTRTMRVSGAESLCAAANIFVGVESAFVIRPHLARMTRSELCVVLTTGMATVASNVMALYVSFLHRDFPTIAGHLVSASILSAPAALVMAKLMVPETEEPDTLGQAIRPHYERENSAFEAIINGANSGVTLVLGIVALLLAVLGLVRIADFALTWTGGHLNAWAGWGVDWSFKGLLGYLFYPFTLLLGVPLAEAGAVARIIGERTVVTEVVGYLDLAGAMASGAVSGRSAVIAAYALCGFAHVASVAIFVGGTAALVPSRTRDIAQMGLRALVAATLACLATGAVAGVFATDHSVLFGGG